MSTGQRARRARWITHQPDYIDVNAMVATIGEEFNLLVRWELRTTADDVQVLCRGLKVKGFGEVEVVYQSMAKVPLKSSKALESLLYQTSFDIWLQADREDPAARRVTPDNPPGRWVSSKT